MPETKIQNSIVYSKEEVIEILTKHALNERPSMSVSGCFSNNVVISEVYDSPCNIGDNPSLDIKSITITKISESKYKNN